MNLRTRLYLLKFSNNAGYTTGMRDYLKKETIEGNLNLKQLKYLYKNLYKKSSYIQQNIYPVSQAMIKGAETEDIESLSKKLLDANNYSIYSKGYHNDKYNKLYSDLEFILNKYCDYKNRLPMTTSYKNAYIYIKTLNEARQNEQIGEDKIYNYVEKEAIRNYINQRKHMKEIKKTIGSTNTSKWLNTNIRHTSKYYFEKRERESEKEKTL